MRLSFLLRLFTDGLPIRPAFYAASGLPWIWIPFPAPGARSVANHFVEHRFDILKRHVAADFAVGDQSAAGTAEVVDIRPDVKPKRSS